MIARPSAEVLRGLRTAAAMLRADLDCADGLEDGEHAALAAARSWIVEVVAACTPPTPAPYTCRGCGQTGPVAELRPGRHYRQKHRGPGDADDGPVCDGTPPRLVSTLHDSGPLERLQAKTDAARARVSTQPMGAKHVAVVDGLDLCGPSGRVRLFNTAVAALEAALREAKSTPPRTS